MKNNIIRCAAFAMLSAFALTTSLEANGMRSQPLRQKKDNRMFGSNLSFLKRLFGEGQSEILSELWNRSPQVESVVITLITDLIENTIWAPVDPANPEVAQAQNWETFNAALFQKLINGPSQTIDELWNHSQKHIFSINAESAQQSAQAGQLGRGNISSKIARNTILVLKTNNARKAAMEFFIKSKPRLEKDGNDIAFVSSFNFPLPLDICEYFIFVEGPERTPLIDGIPHIVPPEIAATATFFGILRLTCWNSGEIVKKSSLFFQMNQRLSSYPESIEQQASVAALLGMNRFIENAPLSEEQLLNISSRLNIALTKGGREYKSKVKTTKNVLLKKLEDSDHLNSLMLPVGNNFATEDGNMSQRIMTEIEQGRFWIEWYSSFFLLFGHEKKAAPMADVMKKWLNLPNDLKIFDWSKRDKFNCMVEESIGMGNFLSNMARFASFVFSPANKDAIYRSAKAEPDIIQFIQSLPDGSAVARALVLAFEVARGPDHVVSYPFTPWLLQNLYSFSFLYLFANPIEVQPILKNDYKMILRSFLNRFPDGKWRRKDGGIVPMYTEQMNFFLSTVQPYSDELTASDIIALGFKDTMPQDIADYMYYTTPTLEEIAKIKNDYGQVKAKDKKKMQQEFRKNFLYPAFRKYVSERDSSLIQEFDRKHEGGNINTIIRDLREIINQIDKPIESQIIPQE